MLRSLTSLIEKLSESEPTADEESKQGDEKGLIAQAAHQLKDGLMKVMLQYVSALKAETQRRGNVSFLNPLQSYLRMHPSRSPNFTRRTMT